MECPGGDDRGGRGPGDPPRAVTPGGEAEIRQETAEFIAEDKQRAAAALTQPLPPPPPPPPGPSSPPAAAAAAATTRSIFLDPIMVLPPPPPSHVTPPPTLPQLHHHQPPPPPPPPIRFHPAPPSLSSASPGLLAIAASPKAPAAPARPPPAKAPSRPNPASCNRTPSTSSYSSGGGGNWRRSRKPVVVKDARHFPLEGLACLPDGARDAAAFELARSLSLRPGLGAPIPDRLSKSKGDPQPRPKVRNQQDIRHSKLSSFFMAVN